jgi:hypothetical protein
MLAFRGAVDKLRVRRYLIVEYHLTWRTQQNGALTAGSDRAAQRIGIVRSFCRVDFLHAGQPKPSSVL